MKLFVEGGVQGRRKRCIAGYQVLPGELQPLSAAFANQAHGIGSKRYDKRLAFDGYFAFQRLMQLCGHE